MKRCWRCKRPLQTEDRNRIDFLFEDGLCDNCLSVLEVAQAVADFPEEWAGTFAQMEAEYDGEGVAFLKQQATAFSRGVL